MGVPATPSGHSAEPVVSALRESVPNAGMLTCIVCDREFESAANDPLFDAIPYAGTLFYSSGHYGSTVFDSFDGAKLEIVVCDECLKERYRRVALVIPATRPQRVVWDEFASAIEARSDATGTGAAEGESAPGRPTEGGNNGPQA